MATTLPAGGVCVWLWFGFLLLHLRLLLLILRLPGRLLRRLPRRPLVFGVAVFFVAASFVVKGGAGMKDVGTNLEVLSSSMPKPRRGARRQRAAAKMRPEPPANRAEQKCLA